MHVLFWGCTLLHFLRWIILMIYSLYLYVSARIFIMLGKWSEWYDSFLPPIVNSLFLKDILARYRIFELHYFSVFCQCCIQFFYVTDANLSFSFCLKIACSLTLKFVAYFFFVTETWVFFFIRKCLDMLVCFLPPCLPSFHEVLITGLNVFLF